MLPTLSIPEFKTKLPSTGKNIKFRPFLVKEEKILLIALEDGEKEVVVEAVLDLLKNCVLSKIDIDSLPTFDIEWLFLQIRSKSVGEQIEMMLSHGGKTECTAKTKTMFNIEDVKVIGEVSDGKIELEDGIGIKLSYPTYKREKTVEKNAENLFELIKTNVVYVYDADNIYDEFTEDEISQWIDGLNQEQFEKILEFFTQSPSIRHMIEWKCSECGEDDFAIVEGLKDFFMLV